MPLFNVEAMDPQGKRIKTQIDASSPNDAILKVKVRGYKPLSVKPAMDGVPAPGSAKTAAPPATPPSSPSQPSHSAPPPEAPIGVKTGKKGGLMSLRIGGGGVSQTAEAAAPNVDEYDPFADE